jgi:hypothetical protein
VTANQIIAFLTIALQPGVTQRDLEGVLNMRDWSVARTIVVSPQSTRGMQGHALIDDERKGDLVMETFLTDKGKVLLDILPSHMKGERF